MVRPKKYEPGQAPTAKERLAKSKESLAAAGGKMINLRLSPEANQALKTIMETEEFKTETDAVNQSLIDRSKRNK